MTVLADGDAPLIEVVPTDAAVGVVVVVVWIGRAAVVVDVEADVGLVGVVVGVTAAVGVVVVVVWAGRAAVVVVGTVGAGSELRVGVGQADAWSGVRSHGFDDGEVDDVAGVGCLSTG